jgi:hypothetical protein
MTNTTQTSAETLRTRAMEFNANAAQQNANAHSLLAALTGILGLTADDADACVSDDGQSATMDGIYFERTDAGLKCFIDAQDGEGAVGYVITSLTELGTLMEEYGDGNFADVREYAYALADGSTESMDTYLLPRTEAQALVVSNPALWTLSEYSAV